MKWCDVNISRILRTICETMSKRKSIFRRDSSVRLRQIHFFCDLSVRCHFTSPQTYSCDDCHASRPGRSTDALQPTDACEIKIRINIQILNRYTTHSSKVPFAIFFPHFVQKIVVVHYTFGWHSHAYGLWQWR